MLFKNHYSISVSTKQPCSKMSLGNTMFSICGIQFYPKNNFFICNPLRQRGSSYPAGHVFISKDGLT